MKRHASKNRLYRRPSTLHALHTPGLLRCSIAKILGLSLLGLSPVYAGPDVNELPSGGQITQGSGNIGVNGNTLTVHQDSAKLVGEWNTFNIGENATVKFDQPNAASVALNRIADQNGSVIQGHLNATGQVYLLNPHGVIFGPKSQVDVGGLVASSQKLSDVNFLKGNLQFTDSAGNALVENQGQITAHGGVVAFIAPQVSNSGTITDNGGTVALAAGEQVTLDFNGDGLINVKVDKAALNALAENKGLIQADAGTVVMTAQSANALMDTVVNNEGVIQAGSLQHQGGRILLDGGDAGLVHASGSLDVSSGNARGGQITVTGDKLLVGEGARMNADGADVGGTILVGGSWQNNDASMHQASGVYVAKTAVLAANATDQGDGGTIVVRSDIDNASSATRAYGSFQAKGGVNGGNGGRIETSGHWLDTAAISVDASAAHRRGGQWLLDPYDVVIGASASGTAYGASFTPGANSNILASDVSNSLSNGTDVTITTGSGGGSVGDITVNSAIGKTGGGTATLSLQAANTISLNAGITSTHGVLNVDLLADHDHNGAGIIILGSPTTSTNIDTHGGYLNFGDGAQTSINGVNTLVGGDVYVGGNAAIGLTTGGGALTFNGEMLIANSNGLNIATSGGNVEFKGLLNSGNHYDFITANINWNAAKSAAEAGNAGNGSLVGDHYLATVTSRLENAVAGYRAGYLGAWLGAERVTGIGSDAVWRWVTGPEGLMGGGQGLPFFTEAPTVAAVGGGTPYASNSYSNWNSNEPNNNNTGTTPNMANGTANGLGEYALQFSGNNGRWNDLNPTKIDANGGYDIIGYVRETNLQASPLNINAGAGTVTFDAAVGGHKALDALTITAAAIAVNGGAITTEGLQTYNGNTSFGQARTTLTQTNPGGGIHINGSFDAGGKTLIMDSAGTVTDAGGGSVTAANLQLLGSGGHYSLTSANNLIGTLAADTGSVSLVNSTALTIGSVNSSNGISATGIIDIATLSGDLTFTQHIVTSDATTAAVTLNAGKSAAAGTAAGGNLLFTGSPSITTGAGGRATLYSGSVSGSSGLTAQVGSGSGRFRYNSDEVTSNFTAPLGSGLYAIYRERPTITISADDKAVTYGTAPVLTTSISGSNGDSALQALATAASVTVGGTRSTTGNYTAGLHGLTPGGAVDQLGYLVSYSDGALTVNQKTLTWDGSINNRSYNGGTDATIASNTATGTVGGDIIDITATDAQFLTASAGTGKTVNVSGIGLSGTDAANYSIAPTAVATADISKALLTWNGVIANRSYNGGTDATILSNSALGLFGSDHVDISATGAQFQTASAGTGKLVDVSGVSLSGTDAVNYSIAPTAVATADISRALLTWDGVIANRSYNGCTDATILSNNALGLFGSDHVDTSATGAQFQTASAGTGKLVDVSGVSLSGTDAVNYSIAPTAVATADISKALLTWNGVIANRSYNGGADATILSNSVLGLFGADSVDVSAAGAQFRTASAGTGKPVDINGISLSGADAANYSIAAGATTTADINKALLTVTSNDDFKNSNGVAYSGGKGVQFSGLANGESRSVLNGQLTYSGSSQGAVDPGQYTIIPGGLSSDNYSFTYVIGILTLSKNGEGVDTSSTSAISTQTGLTGTANNTTNNPILGPGYSGHHLGPSAGAQSIGVSQSNTLISVENGSGAASASGRLLLSTDTGSQPISFSRGESSLTLSLNGNSNGMYSVPFGLVKDEGVSLPVFDARTGVVEPQGGLKVIETGDNLIASPTAVPPGSIPSLPDRLGKAQTSGSINAADGGTITFGVTVTTNGLLIISLPKDSAGRFDDQQLVLLSLVTAQKNLSISLESIKGVIFR